MRAVLMCFYGGGEVVGVGWGAGEGRMRRQLDGISRAKK